MLYNNCSHHCAQRYGLILCLPLPRSMQWRASIWLNIAITNENEHLFDFLEIPWTHNIRAISLHTYIFWPEYPPLKIYQYKKSANSEDSHYLFRAMVRQGTSGIDIMVIQSKQIFACKILSKNKMQKNMGNVCVQKSYYTSLKNGAL